MNICAHHWHVLIRPNRSQSVCKKKQEHLSIMCVCIILKKKNFSRWVEVFHLVLFIALNGKREFIWKINIFLPSCLFYTSNIIITNASCIGNVELIYLKEFLQMTLLLIWRKITTLYTEVWCCYLQTLVKKLQHNECAFTVKFFESLRTYPQGFLLCLPVSHGWVRSAVPAAHLALPVSHTLSSTHFLIHQQKHRKPS